MSLEFPNGDDSVSKTGITQSGKETPRDSTKNTLDGRVGSVIQEAGIQRENLQSGTLMDSARTITKNPSNEQVDIVNGKLRPAALPGSSAASLSPDESIKEISEVTLARPAKFANSAHVMEEKGTDRTIIVSQEEYKQLSPEEMKKYVETGRIADDGSLAMRNNEKLESFLRSRDKGELEFVGDFPDKFKENIQQGKWPDTDNVLIVGDKNWESFSQQVDTLKQDNSQTPAAATEKKSEGDEVKMSAAEELRSIPSEHLQHVEARLINKQMSPDTVNGSREAISVLLRAVRETIVEKKREEVKEANEQRRIDDQNRQDLDEQNLKTDIKKRGIQKEEIKEEKSEEVAVVREKKVEETLDYIKFRAVSIAKGMLVNEEIFRQFNLELDDMLRSWKMDL